MSEPTTEAGRALLRSDFDTTGWGPRLVREHVTKAVLAIEAEARAADRAELAGALEADWYNGNLDERAYYRVCDLIGLEANPTAEREP